MPKHKRKKPKQLKKTNGLFANEDTKTPFFAPRYSNAFQTICDVNVHPNDVTKFALKKDIRHVGSGLPKIKVLPSGKGLKTSHPCLHETLIEHENVHVKNAKANCKGFKKCLDDEVANNLIFDTVSTAEYNHCKKQHHGGLAESCLADEREAYAKSVEVGERLAKDAKCANEKSLLEKNIEIWKKYAKTPPNC